MITDIKKISTKAMPASISESKTSSLAKRQRFMLSVKQLMAVG
jgi:hypothetical protein